MTKTTFSRRAELRQIARIALPIIAAQLLQIGMGVIDTVMAGRINALSIAAIALGASVWMFVTLVGTGILFALSPIISQHIGANNHPLVREELRQGIWLALSIGIIDILLLFLIIAIMPSLGIKAELIPAANDYIVWIAWSLPFGTLYFVPRSFNEANGNTLPLLWIQLGLLPLNILGNYLFMFGNMGFPEMGAAGAALSTGIAQVIACIALYTYTLSTPKYASYHLGKRMTPPNWAHIYQIFKLGLPIAIGMGMEVGLFTATALLMGRFGADAAASHQIALSIASLIFMVPLGLSMALTVRVGQAVGAKHYQLARQRGQLGILLCGGFTLITAFCLWQFGDFLARLYTNDPVVIGIAAHLLVFAALFQIVDGFQIGAVGVLRGFKDTKIPMLISVVCYWGVGLGTALSFGVYGNMGPGGLWLGLVTGLFVAAIAMNYRFYQVTRLAKNEG